MVGGGHMGGALLARWAELERVSIQVVAPARPAVPPGVDCVADADALDGGRFDLLVVAVKPQLIPAAIPPAARLLKLEGFVLSIAAGAGVAMVSAAAGDHPVVRLMPNMPARMGLGVSGLYAQPAVTADQRALAARMGEAVGTALWLETEDQIDRITAAAGSGPGYVFEFARVYELAARDLGFNAAQARALVQETIAGCMALAAATGDPFEVLRDSIMSKGGTTAAGVAALNGDGGLTARLHAALAAAYDRACALRG